MLISGNLTAWRAIEASETDAKRMLDAYLAVELGGGPNEQARKHARASLDLANQLQHRAPPRFGKPPCAPKLQWRRGRADRRSVRAGRSRAQGSPSNSRTTEMKSSRSKGLVRVRVAPSRRAISRDGGEVAEQIKSDASLKGTPIVFLTALVKSRK